MTQALYAHMIKKKTEVISFKILKGEEAQRRLPSSNKHYINSRVKIRFKF
jgi:hypothetical protein